MDRRPGLLTTILAIALTILVAGCTVTDVDSYRDPTAGAGLTYISVLMYG